jgi:hypothetical protein
MIYRDAFDWPVGDIAFVICDEGLDVLEMLHRFSLRGDFVNYATPCSSSTPKLSRLTEVLGTKILEQIHFLNSSRVKQRQQEFYKS